MPCEDTARDQQSARGRWNQEKVAEAGRAGPGTRLKILIFTLLLDSIGVTKGVSMEVTSPGACFENMSLQLWEEVPDKALWEAECGCRNRMLGVTGREHGSRGGERRGQATGFGSLPLPSRQQGATFSHSIQIPRRLILIAENKTESSVELRAL